MYLADSISRNLSQGQLGQIRGNNPRCFEWVTKRKRKPIYNFDPTNTGDPTQQGHLRFWFDFSRLEGYADGAPVDGISAPIIDYSGRGCSCTQPSAAQRPIFVQSGLNNKSLLQFDGFDDYLGITGIGSWASLQYSFFVVFAFGGIVRPGHVEDIYCLGNVGGEMTLQSASTSAGVNDSLVSYGNPRGFLGSGSIQNYKVRSQGQNFHVVSSSWVPFLSTYVLLMGTDGNHASDYFGDSSGGILSTGPFAGTFSGGGSFVGTGNGGGVGPATHFLQGYIAEIYVYAIGMNLGQIQQHEAYLALKWGLDNQLDGINPYRPVV